MSDRPVEEPDFRLLFEGGPGLYMVLDPDLSIVAASDAYLGATLTHRDEIVGKYVFDVFPDNADDPSADPVVSKSLASFRTVLRTGETDVMGLQRHDVRRPASEGDGFEVRYWSAVNSPIPGPDGSVAYILHRVENVTEFVLAQQRGDEQALLTDALRDRAAQMEADLYARSREAAETSRQLKELNETLEQRVVERTESLRASETRYRTLHESLRDAFVMTAMDGAIVECNELYCELLGYSPEELRTLTYRDLTPERWHAFEEGIIRDQILPRGYSDVYEKEYRRKDGTVIPVELRSVLSRDEEGRPVAMWATVRDISERRRAEAALASMATGVVLYDAAGAIARMNEAAQRMLGVDRDALDETDYPERRARLGITRPDGTPRAEETAAHYRALQGEIVQGEEVVFTGVGEEPLHVVASAAPIRDSAGGIAGAIAVFTDITEQRKAAERLRESEAKYRTLYNSMDQGFFLIDVLFDEHDRPVDLHYVEANDAATRMLGEDYTGRRLTAISPDYEEYWFEIFGEVARTGESVRLERYAAPDQRWYSFYVFRIGGPESRRIGNTFLDITDRKRMEEALRAAEAHLARAQQIAHMGSWSWDVEKDRLFWSDETYRILGLGPREIEPRLEDYLASVHPDDRQAVNAAIEEAFFSGIYRVEFRIVRPDGAERYASSQGALTVAEDGTPIRMDGTVQDITERRATEEALRESERRYRELVESANSAIIRWRRDGTVTYFNEYAQALFGYGADEMIGKSASILVPEQDSTGADLTDLVQEVVEDPDGRAMNVNENVRRDGSRLWMVWTNRPIYDEQGELAEILAVGTDITDRKRTEEAVKKSEARLVEAQRLAKVGDWEWDLATDEVVWSRETHAIFGRDPDLAAPGFWQDQPRYYTPASWVRLNDAVRRVREAGEPYDFEIEVVREDGAHRWLTARGEAVPDAAGAITKLRGTVQDITERKRAEGALRESEERFRSIVESISDSFMAMDRDWRLTFANRRALGYKGLSPEDVVEKTIWEVFPEIVGTPLEAFYRTAMERRKPMMFENSSVVAAGRSFELHAYPSGDGLSVFGQDVTERKRAEEALREYAENLRRSNEDLERFAYVSSHDLQEPLRSIVSFSQLLERRYRGQLGQDADEYIDFIVEGGTRMQTLIQDLLAYSRVNTTKQSMTPTDITEVIAGAERGLAVQLRDAGVVLTHDPMPMVLADPLQIEQVFANLIGNAVKYRHPDVPLRIQIGAREMDGFWEFSIADNGIGIEKEYFEKIFVIFQRLHTRDAYSGTGIGLAIVKRIVDRHGGRVWVESTPGEGSTFFFTLPSA